MDFVPQTEPLAPTSGGKDPETEEKTYEDALDQVKQRESELADKWLNKAKDNYKVYVGDDDSVLFNILYSNTETLRPNLFSQTPKPAVRRRWDESRGDLPAKAMNRMLEFCMDTNIASYPIFTTVIDQCVLDGLLPGLGTFRYRELNGIGFIDYVHFDQYIWAYCRQFERRPWEAFRHDMTKEDIFETFELTDSQKAVFDSEAGKTDTETSPSTHERRPQTFAVYERWDRKTGMRCFLCEQAEGKCLKEEQAPYGFENFFCTPKRPLVFVQTTMDTLPRPMYNLYKQQAQELNNLTHRIKNVVQAIKVRGMYAGRFAEIASVFNDGDNENKLIPAEDAAAVLNLNKGLDAYIWLAPIDKFIVVLQNLLQAREAVKSTIYEILGIGDILRGQSKASETLGAQQIKDKWGSLRIKNLRSVVDEFVREALRLLAEGAAKNTPEELWGKITALPLPSGVEVAVLAQSGQPAPEVSWPSVLGVLKNDLTRAYTIDIEPNSTVDAEATEEKEEMQGFMNALGQTMSGLAPLAETSPEGFKLSTTILAAVCNKFKLGPNIEPLIKALPVPKALQGPPPQIAEMQKEMEAKGQELDGREAQMTAESENLEKTRLQLEEQLRSIEDAQKELVSNAQQLKADTTQAIKDIDFKRRESILAIREAEVALAGKAAALKAAQQPRPAAPAKKA